MQKYAHLNRDVKNGAIHIPIKKKWVSHIHFPWKKGAYRIPGYAEKGGYSGRTSVPCHIYGVTPPPPLPPRVIYKNTVACANSSCVTQVDRWEIVLEIVN